MGLSHLLLSVVDALAFLPCDCYSQPARTCRITASCDGMLLLKAVAFFFLRQSQEEEGKRADMKYKIYANLFYMYQVRPQGEAE